MTKFTAFGLHVVGYAQSAKLRQLANSTIDSSTIT